MAVQIETEELNGCKTYFRWIGEKIKAGTDMACGIIPENLCRLMFATDFIWEMEEDGIRAKDATDIRKVYAEEVGEENKKNEREIDRIWKSVHGKCSVLELIFSVCIRLDGMVNEGEKWDMVPDFFRILCANIGFAGILEPVPEKVQNTLEKYWKADLDRWMERKYDYTGNGGGLFPLKKPDGKDQTKVSIWYQMNSWLDETLDEDEHFMMENFTKKKRK